MLKISFKRVLFFSINFNFSIATWGHVFFLLLSVKRKVAFFWTGLQILPGSSWRSFLLPTVTGAPSRTIGSATTTGTRSLEDSVRNSPSFRLACCDGSAGRADVGFSSTLSSSGTFLQVTSASPSLIFQLPAGSSMTKEWSLWRRRIRVSFNKKRGFRFGPVLWDLCFLCCRTDEESGLHPGPWWIPDQDLQSRQRALLPASLRGRSSRSPSFSELLTIQLSSLKPNPAGSASFLCICPVFIV